MDVKTEAEIAGLKVPLLDLYIVRGAEKRRAEAEDYFSKIEELFPEIDEDGIKIPRLDLYVVKGAEKRRGEAQLAGLRKSRDMRNKVTARLVHENLVLRNRLARWESREVSAKAGKGK